ncbi:ABC transporter ATP-binding protein [Streptomyces sp. PTM05]|uniref:ABC transporter ATP-binding protein n=1 Tax=Streptantibioticus parmotrematis TaxID=2873249 RepID=A0ABS7QNC2_9ACTN|nr:ABC transporter ATP-binding protein [Streptantibioticus parmotrematis]MBY8883304.1 ABC transporter ATP-binding protein [Streptantibioticus parmotrematis]
MAVIEVRDLAKTYGAHTALHGVSFSVERGEIFGLLGPNGAGKTTTVECVEGLRRPDAGSVRVLGLDPTRDGRRLRGLIGVQLQEAHLPDALRVGEALELYASFYPAPRDPARLLAQWGLQDKRRTRFGKLSGGQKQRLFIALALVGDPRVVFLDELTTGLDPQARRATWELVRQMRDGGVTVVLVSHFMDEVAELCDRAAILDGGRVVAQGTPAELVAGAGARTTLTFRPTAPLDLDALAALPAVASVARDGETVEVTGGDRVTDQVTAFLARGGIVVANLRIHERSLDDAYVTITGGTK